MRTLILATAMGLASANLFAQNGLQQAYDIELNPRIQVLTPTAADYIKVDTTFHRMKYIWSNEMIETYCPKLVRRFGLDETKSLIFDIACVETAGDSTKTLKGENSPLLHVTWIMYEDYAQRNPNGPKFSFKDLFAPGNLHLSLIILDWHANTKVYGGYDTLEEIVRTWNGGYLGAKDNLTLSYFTKRGMEGWQEHQVRLKNTRDFYAKFLMFRKIRIAMEKSGRGVMM